MRTNLSSHPILHLLELISKYSIEENTVLYFSNLQYDYQTQVNIRIYTPTLCKDISLIWLEQKLQSLQNGYELCFHSKIETPSGKTFHIPLIDFNVATFDTETQEIIKERVYKQKDLAKFIPLYKSMKIYFSGRSFHGYGDRLLTDEEWREYTTSLLLLNYTKNVNEYSNIVDTRWVAHRLLEGFSGLRWSCNTNKSLQYVTLTDKKMLV